MKDATNHPTNPLHLAQGERVTLCRDATGSPLLAGDVLVVDQVWSEKHRLGPYVRVRLVRHDGVSLRIDADSPILTRD